MPRKRPELVKSLFGVSPHTPQVGDGPKAVRARGWCPECKQRLRDCECREHGGLFDAREERP